MEHCFIQNERAIKHNVEPITVQIILIQSHQTTYADISPPNTHTFIVPCTANYYIIEFIYCVVRHIVVNIQQRW